MFLSWCQAGAKFEGRGRERISADHSHGTSIGFKHAIGPKKEEEILGLSSDKCEVADAPLCRECGFRKV